MVIKVVQKYMYSSYIPVLFCDCEATTVAVIFGILIEEYRRLPLGSCIISIYMIRKTSS